MTPREAHCRELVARCAATPLFAGRGRSLTLGDGCIPALVDYSFEDKAAKGLRSLRDAPGAPPMAQYFTAMEVAAEAPLLLLLGETGAGKSVFARRLALHLAGEAVGHQAFNRAALAGPVPRDAAGTLIEEAWQGVAPLPILVEAQPGAMPLLPDLDGPLLLILDGVDAWGEDGADLLAEVSVRAARHGATRVLALGEAETCGGWRPLPGFRRHTLLPLLPAQRADWRARCGGGPAELPGHPGLLSLALAFDEAVPEEALVARWLESTPPDDPLRERRFLRERQETKALAARPVAEVVRLFQADPARWARPLRHLARRGRCDALCAALSAGESRGVVLAADMHAASPGTAAPEGLAAALCAAIARGDLPLPARVRAGLHLASLGDPRDLEALVAVPAGVLAMGSALHVNSAPPHAVPVGAFRIGRHPVTNRLYGRFVTATGRPWRSRDGLAPERANAPAVDLTWHDARACCDWLTETWRREGRIAREELVRLPTEAEWEWAARGTQPDSGVQVYPWGGAWVPARCNGEESGLNDTCAVGLFPAGRTACGADDMVGQVWEWCSTNWGDDMATPTWGYPYRADDGREDSWAPGAIRRVLRGGCFSSGAEKATCTYRGSLEPGGFWRGNGFRVVVAT